MNNSGLMTSRDLEYRTQEILVQKRQERFFIEAGKLIPHSEDFPIGAKYRTYRILDVQGRATVIANGVVRSEELGMYMAERFTPIEYIYQEFCFSFLDDIHSDYAQVDLSGSLLELATEVVYNTIEEFGWVGYTSSKIFGLANNPNVNVVALPADGTGPSLTALSGKSATQQLRDLSSVADQTMIVSKHSYVADTLLVPTTVWQVITSTKVNPGINSTTVYADFLENQKLKNGIKRIICVPQLDTAGPANTPMMIAYKNDPSVLMYLKSAGIRRRPFIEGVRGFESALYANSGGVAIKQGVGVTYAFNV
jgi:hypothetical protein